MEFVQYYVRDGHPEGAVTARVQRYPLVRIFADLREIGRKHHCLGAVVPGLGEEVTVRGARHIEAGAHVGNHFGVKPIRTFTDVSLLAPDFREGRR